MLPGPVRRHKGGSCGQADAVRTVGVDLAAAPERTGLCRIDWENATVEVWPRPVDDGTLVDVVAASDLAGFDVPLGWPDAFVDALVALRDCDEWPPAAMDPPTDRVALRYRLTDRVLIASGARPLSVSTDRIGVAAMRAARLQHLLRRAGVPVDRSGTSGRIVESYPAGALRVWGLVHRRYKHAANVATLETLVTDVLARCAPPLGEAAAASLREGDDDDFDAFVCALIARAAALGFTTRPSSDQLDVARREGWIHLPTVPLEQLLAG